MTREELIAYDRWLTENKWGSSEIITPEQAADLYLAKHPLPPAEGAVPDNAAEQNKRMREWFKERTGLDDTLLSIHMKQIDVMLKGVQPQSTAGGAEEILDKYPHSIEYPSFVHENSAIAAMTEFATLHAQRIAERMVEEKLKKEYERGIEDGKIIGKHGSVSYIE